MNSAGNEIPISWLSHSDFKIRDTFVNRHTQTLLPYFNAPNAAHLSYLKVFKTGSNHFILRSVMLKVRAFLLREDLSLICMP